MRRGLVGVRGLGTAFEDLHYLNRVTYNIRRGNYKWSASLPRNGLVSSLPKVAA